MAIFKCKMCGGDLQVQDGVSVIECDYCGTKQTVSATDDEKRVNLYNRANHLRMNSEFDKAAGLYEQIVAEFPNDAEAYWGLCLCNYGIEYVDDPVTSAKIPTIHRASFEKMRKDENYERALENADATARLVYQEQAKEIDRIMGEVLAISRDEQPYDIFICYKETDEVGGRTVDSVIAQNIYDALSDKGYKVFFSRITLEDKLGAQYEPYIFAALNSAKVMLAVGTDYEYYNAVWVKNEWRRFWKLAAADKSKVLIPCYKDMDVYDFPNEFKGLQAQDMGKVGAMQDLLRGIDKIFDRDKKAAVAASASVGNTASLSERAFMFLEDGEWENADTYCEKVLDLEPKNGNAYLGKLMAELQVRKPDDLKNCETPFDDRDSYKKAVRFGDEKLKNYLVACTKYITERNANAQKEMIYNETVLSLQMAKVTSEYKKAAERFRSISGYKDADEQAAECEKKAEECARAEEERVTELTYQNAVNKMRSGKESIAKYRHAIYELRTIADYKDSARLIEKCEQEILALEELEAAKMSEEEQRRIEREEEERHLEARRKDEEERLEKEKEIKRVIFVIVPIICACIALVFFLNAVIVPAIKTHRLTKRYDKAVALMEDEEYDEAIAVFETLDGYFDSNKKIEECQDGRLNTWMNDQTVDFSNVEKGDIVKFGYYEQDDDSSNGKEEIEWQILAIKDGKMLVISRYVLDCCPYDEDYSNCTWTNSSVRIWLNEEFLPNAIGSKYQEKILSLDPSSEHNPDYAIDAESNTQDRVFLLSVSEAKEYILSDDDRRCSPTPYAETQGTWVSDDYETTDGEATCWWWLRTPGMHQYYAAGVDYDGSISDAGIDVVLKNYGVRPAMWISLE